MSANIPVLRRLGVGGDQRPLPPMGRPTASSSEGMSHSQYRGMIEGQHGDFAEQGLDGFEQALRDVFVPAAAQLGGARKSLRSNYGLDPNDFPKAHEHKGAACGARGLEIVAQLTSIRRSNAGRRFHVRLPVDRDVDLVFSYRKGIGTSGDKIGVSRRPNC